MQCNIGLFKRQQLGFGSKVNSQAARKTILRATKEASQSELSGEWPVNINLSSYEECHAFYVEEVLKESMDPTLVIGDIMNKDPQTAMPSDTVASIKGYLAEYTGLPVVNEDTELVGVVSYKDVESKEGSSVSDIMTTPGIACKIQDVVAEAACKLLKYDIHRLPVIDDKNKVIGIVTRTDVFKCMELELHPEQFK